MRICKLISTSGLPMTPRCYNTAKGYQWQRESMYKYGMILARHLLSDIDNNGSLHIACLANDIDTLAKGVVDELDCADKRFSLYWLRKKHGEKIISACRHEYKGANKTCVLIMPILNEAIPTAAILNNLYEYSQTEKIYLITPVVVGDAHITLQKIIKVSINKRLEIVTLCHDIKRNYAKVSEYLPAVPNDKSECNEFFLNTIRQTRRTFNS